MKEKTQQKQTTTRVKAQKRDPREKLGNLAALGIDHCL